jgi:hypothetical protein
MKRFAFAVVLSFALFLVPAFAASDVSGTWSGSFSITNSDGETQNEPAFMSFKQTGTEITGTAGPTADKQYTILKGKIEGNTITFEVQAEVPLIKFTLNLVDGHLKGEAKMEHEGESRKAILDLQRTTK